MKDIAIVDPYPRTMELIFSKPVAEIALGFTLSLLRNIHGANQDFINKKEKYGLDGNHKASLL